MAPSLPVYSREEIKTLYPNLFPERIPKNGASTNTNIESASEISEEAPLTDNFGFNIKDCSLHSLTQHQCTFDGNKVVCVPFKRLFARCLDKDYSQRKEVIGYKLTPSHKEFKKDTSTNFYRNIELTDWYDNDYHKALVDGDQGKEVNADLLKQFFQADKVLKKRMAEYYENIMKSQKREG